MRATLDHPSLQRPLSALMRGRYGLELLLERRLWLYLSADIVLVVSGLFRQLGEGGKDYDLYIWLVLVPILFIGLPALSGVVALERRAGSLDLALAVPSTERYFIRRVAPLCLFLVIQSWVILYFGLDHPGNLFRSMVQSFEVTLLLAAISLFWAVWLRTSGAVLAASAVSVGLLSQWIFFDPMADRLGFPEIFWGIPVPKLRWLWNAFVLAVTTVILFQYARARLRRPETLLD